MRNILIIIAGAVILGSPACAASSGTASAPAIEAADASAVNGAWVVDLSVDPAEPYTKPMHLLLLADGSVNGDFYESAIEEGRWKTDRGRTCVSFRTSDGRGPYETATCLDGDVMRGQTWAVQRKFLFVWNAERE